VGALKIKPDDTLSAALGNILRKRMATTFAMAEKVKKKNDVESLHQMRISARRLQSLMKIFREVLPRKAFKNHHKNLRMLLRASGSIRENDMFLSMLAEHRKTLLQSEGRVIDNLIARRQHQRAKDLEYLRGILAEFAKTGFHKQMETYLDLRA